VVLLAQGRGEAARRAFRNAAELASSANPGQLLRLGDGITAGQLADAARVQLASLPMKRG